MIDPHGSEMAPDPQLHGSPETDAVPKSPQLEEVQSQQAKQEAESASPATDPSSDNGDRRPEDPKDADDFLTRRMPGREAADAAVLAESRRYTRRSFLVAGAATAAGYGAYRYLEHGPQEDMQPALLRRTLQANAALSRGLTRDRVLAPTYPLSRAETLRVNGIYGLKRTLVPASWRLQVVGVRDAQQSARFSPDVTAWEYLYSERRDMEDQGHDTKVAPQVAPQAAPQAASLSGESVSSSAKMAPAAAKNKAAQDEHHTGRKPRGKEEAGESYSTLQPGTAGLLLQMDDITRLPRHELVTQFKCIEGWSQIVHWAGVRMADFLDLYPPALIDGKEPRYVYMETPDGDYYNGYDLETLRQPQALLVTEMMGQPLTQFHGAPLRLHLPMKYGYKQIKRIGLIAYTNEKPDDYWTELGYDWYAGL